MIPNLSVAALGYRALLRPLLFRGYQGDAERIHERTLAVLARMGGNRPALAALRALWNRHRRPVTVAGIQFPGLVGLAAGMDKDGVAIRTWGALGFGFVELGTVTAESQPGNDKPRLFRLPDSQAIINRMGFNNLGAQTLADRLAAAGVSRGNMAVGIPIGISIGKTKNVPLAEATEDYLISLRTLAPYADYVAINVSSPNTPGLRALQDAPALATLISTLASEAWRLAAGRPPVPIFVKVAPDLTEAALEDAVQVCTKAGAEGLIATNTTLSRDGLQTDEPLATESGGLSGAPLTRRAREVVRFLAERTSLPIIGAGGIMTRDDGQAMLDAGASLLQIYTGYVYAGPALLNDLNRLEPDSSEP
ncbi:MAG: quinone-dependent dihydroorotate dehydrogenase [Propionibacteriaceae bacterium]